MREPYPRGLLFIVIFAVIGGIGLFSLIRAGGQSVSVETETGSIDTVATREQDFAASGGQFVQFNAVDPPAGDLRQISFSPSSEIFNNPGRGFHRWRTRLPGGSFPSRFGSEGFDAMRSNGYSVGLVVVRIDDYTFSSISQSFLSGLDQMFADARAAGVKLVLKFSYNDPNETGGWAECTRVHNEASLEQILAHISQVGPVLSDNSDILLTLQAGFVGAWGEWHCSANGLTEPGPSATIHQALLDNLSPEITIQARNPWRKAQLFSTTAPLPRSQAFNGSDRARIAHHNDCFLTNADDTGTFVDGGGQFLGSADAWRAYVGAESLYLPVGGETCWAPDGIAYWNCSASQSELRRQGWTYLNRDYWQDIHNHWISNGCYDTINRNLGYRFSLEHMSISTSASRGGAVELNFDINNQGYAALFRERPVYLVLTGNGGTYQLPLSSIEPRDWLAGQTTSVSTVIPVPANVPAGSYNLALWLPDIDDRIRNRSEFAIRFANQNVWNDSSGWNVIPGSIQIN